MTERDLPMDDIKELAEEAMDDKRAQSGEEARARELYDVPTETAGELADEQAGTGNEDGEPA